MKQNSISFRKWVLIFFLASASSIPCTAQTGNAGTTKKVTGNEISISIAGIDYDDANFSALKESIKKDPKCQDIKQSYAQSIAKLSLHFQGDATALWDELPASAKQPFKISTIESSKIELKLKNAVTTAEPAKANTVTNTSKVDEVCKNCYFNMCKYDAVKTFEGVQYRQVNKDNGTYYYNCDNGVVIVKQVITNGYGTTTNITRDTVLMSNAPIGTTWGVVQNATSFFGLNSQTMNVYKLAAKGLSLTVDGSTYHDVIMVNYSGRTDDNTFGNSSFSKNYYYAKGVGLIKTEDGDLSSAPKLTTQETEADKKETTKLDALIKTMKGKVDETMTGAWKFHDTEMNWDTYYVFNLDGSYQYYVGSVDPHNLMSDPKSYWRLDGDHLELAGGGWDKVYRYELQKKNDAATPQKEYVGEPMRGV